MSNRRLPPTYHETTYSYPEEHDRFYECPRCAKQTLYQRSAHHFVCLWCGFRRDLSERESNFLPNLMALLTLLVVVLLIRSMQ